MGIFKQVINTDKDKELPFFLHIARTECIGIRTYTRMQSFFGAPSVFYNSSVEKLEKTGIFSKKQISKIIETRLQYEPYSDFENTRKMGINVIPYEDRDYPEGFTRIKDAPPIVFLKGKLNIKDIPCAAVIGARECTPYGTNVARRLGELMGERGVSLISGMARGIDSTSQIACLDSGGYSLAFLGGGVDIVYPRESGSLYERLLECGGIMSEFPPGTKPQKSFFALRNRLISATSDVVCVVEARDKSGTMITVDCALDQGKEVYAVPGRITDITSLGTNELIKQGATMITDLNGFLDEFMERFYIERPFVTSPVNYGGGGAYALNSGETRLLKCLDENSFTPEQYVNKTGMEAFEILSACMSLSQRGFLINAGAGRFRATIEGMNVKNNLC